MESSEWNCGDSVKKCGIGLAVMWKGEEGRANCEISRSPGSDQENVTPMEGREVNQFRPLGHVEFEYPGAKGVEDQGM